MRFTVYIDYQEFMHMDMEAHFVSVTRADLRKMCFGYGLNDQNFMGEFDEIRLSRVALSPSQFLHLRRPQRGAIILFR